jgi:hypothetical protein
MLAKFLSITKLDLENLILSRNLSDLFIYSNTCLKIISFCSYESVGIPQVKSVRSNAQYLGSQYGIA